MYSQLVIGRYLALSRRPRSLLLLSLRSSGLFFIGLLLEGTLLLSEAICERRQGRHQREAVTMGVFTLAGV